MKSLCLDEDILFHPRFRRRLTGYEQRDLLYVCFLAQQGKDPAFIPAAKMDDVRLRLDIKEDVWARRLAKWEAQGLVKQSVDGLDITLLWTDDEDEDAAPPAAPVAALDADAARRAKDRARQAARRARVNAEQDAVSRRVVRPVSPAVTENVTLSGATVTPDERDVSRLVTPGVTPPYVDVNVDVSEKEDSIAISSSEDVNVTSRRSEPNVTPLSQPVTENVTLSGATVTPDERDEPLAEVRKAAVADALRLTGDSPKWTPRWSRLWSHCQQHGQLPLWAEACAVFGEHRVAGRIPAKVGPGQWLQGILLQKLADAGCPLPSGTAQERADVQRQIRESLQLPPEQGTPSEVQLPPGEPSSPAPAPAAPPQPVAPDPDVRDKAVRHITRTLGDERQTARIAALVDVALTHGHASLPDTTLNLAVDARASGSKQVDGAWFCKQMTRLLIARKVALPPEMQRAEEPPAAPESEDVE